MKRLFGLLVASLVVVVGMLAAFGIPSIFAGSGGAVASAASNTQQIGMKVLLITDNTNEASYQDWENTLDREGVPFDSVVTTPVSGEPAPGGASTFSTLPALSSTAADGTQVANYEGVVVATSGTEGLSTAQWDTLETFEHQFSVREVTAYLSGIDPYSEYGLNPPNPAGGGNLPSTTALTLTADGKTVFPYLNQVSLDPTAATYAYLATPLAGANVDTLISGPGGSSLLGIYTTPDGRQTMFQTFNENQYYLQSQLLRHGELDWLERNTYFGDQRNYLEMDIDDTFTPDDAWNATTTPGSIDYSDADAMRMNAGDVATAATWEANNNFRMDQLFNMGGTVAYQADNTVTPGTDPVLAAFQATCSSNCGPGNAGAGKPYSSSFGWISHTYDTPYLDVGCATQNYIEAELNENSAVAADAPGGTAGTGGLGLATDDSGTTALGAEDPHVFVPGNHSGFADLVPGNPATVDPPILDTAAASLDTTTTSTLPAGYYEYAISDQFTNSASAGQSQADVSAAITVAAGDWVTLTWQSICHATDYVIYRGYNATSATGPFTWTQLAPAAAQDSAYGTVSTPFSATLPDNSSGDPTSTTDVTNGGELEQTFTDDGSATAEAGGLTTPPTTEGAIETPWEQNPYFIPALEAVGITAVGDDGSKPYPDPSTDEFGYGVSYTGTEYPADATFVEGTAQVVPRHPINIYYNASTDYQELNEYQSIYGTGGTSPDTAVCPTGTCTWSNVIDQNVSGMFGYLMANDPRPSYVHQTNIMGTPPAGSETPGSDLPPASYTPQPGGGPDEPTGTGNPTTTGDGTLYQVLDPLLAQYNEYFNSSAPIEQLTEQAIANLLAEQQAWSATTGVSGSIEGNVVTVDNATGSSIWVPLTGTNVGSPYAGTQSGWVDAPTGTSTDTALAAWPTEPTGPVDLTPITGPTPGCTVCTGTNVGSKAQSVKYVVVQVAPKTVRMKKGKVTVSLKCEATKGKTPKGKVCSGKFTMRVKGVKRTLTHTFRIKTGKVYRISIKVPNVAQAAIKSKRKNPVYKASLVISTNQSHAKPLIKRGTLKIKT